MSILKMAMVAGALMTAQATPAPTPDPSRPTPTFDTVRPNVPALKRPTVLIFSKTNSFRHASIPAAVAAVETIVRARGWSSFTTENAAIFNAEQLARFDLIVFASASGDMFTPDQTAAFKAYIASGRAFVGLHAAGDGSHPDWYDAMLGAGPYNGHMGGADQFQPSDMIVLDRTHPATRHLGARWRWTEEFYAWATPSAADAHVLVRLDETGMRLDARHSMGDRHAVIWWRCEGRARIFYSALGHKPETFADATHLRMIDGALAWAARRAGGGCG